MGDLFVGEAVENILPEHVMALVKKINMSSLPVSQIGSTSRWKLPCSVTLTIEGSWFDAKIRFDAFLWTYTLWLKRTNKVDSEGNEYDRLITNDFAGEATAFLEDFTTIKLTI